MRDLERVTAEQPPVEVNGYRKWLMGILAALILLGVGGLIAWGAQGETVKQHTTAIKEVREIQLQDGRTITTLKAKQDMLIEGQHEMRTDIKSILRYVQRGRRK